jgi:NADPH-dependent ferric siderophore reductase
MDDDQALLQALASRLAQSPDAQVFFAAEKSVAALARDLIKASSMPASQARAAAYWTREESHDRSVESES